MLAEASRAGGEQGWGWGLSALGMCWVHIVLLSHCCRSSHGAASPAKIPTPCLSLSQQPLECWTLSSCLFLGARQVGAVLKGCSRPC